MRYPGGKGGVFRHIVSLMPPHETYIETHLGGGNVLERKKPAKRNIGIDIDQRVCAVWRDRRAGLPFELELHCVDAVKFLGSFKFTGREMVYADPPYVRSTRRDPSSLYRFEYTDAQHVELIDVLRSLPCMVMVSGYDSQMYRDAFALPRWRLTTFQAKTRQGMAAEFLWCNFEAPVALHDARYVGGDYRERERIKRKKTRWRSHFESMQAGERQVVLEALLDVTPPDVVSRAVEGRAAERARDERD